MSPLALFWWPEDVLVEAVRKKPYPKNAPRGNGHNINMAHRYGISFKEAAEALLERAAARGRSVTGRSGGYGDGAAKAGTGC